MLGFIKGQKVSVMTSEMVFVAFWFSEKPKYIFLQHLKKGTNYVNLASLCTCMCLYKYLLE